MKITKFEDIESWKEARILVNEIYSFTQNGKISKNFGLRDQVQRAAVSIMSNIAEGFDSGTNKSFVVFLNYAYRFVSEVQSLLYVMLDAQYIVQEKFEKLYNRTGKIKNLIGGFIQYLKKNNKPNS